MKKRTFLYLILLLLCNVLHSRENQQPVWYIVQISDTQLGFIAQNESMEAETELFKTAIQKINHIKPDMVIITGDFVHSPRNKLQVKKFKELCKLFDASVGLYLVPGNHDIGNSSMKENLEYYKQLYNYDRFSVHHRGVQLTGINTCLIKDNAKEADEQYEWLKAELKKGKRTSHRIVFGHHPFFMYDFSEKENYSNQSMENRAKYHDLFQKNRIAFYFAGHLHDNAYAKHEKVEYVTTTATGKQLGAVLPGIRIIRIEGDSVKQSYFPLEEVPETLELLEALFTTINQNSNN